VTEPSSALLGRLSGAAFGTGQVMADEVGDSRSGQYWLITRPRMRTAVKMALITGRPLLVVGPSGSGKSALAHAVAETLGWTYYETVVTSQTRLDVLTGWVDLVLRLNEAEVAGRLSQPFPENLDAFVQPGVLWWALDPTTAASAGRGGHDDPGRPARRPADDPGAVVLIDEIDKAEPDLPNNLLVPLGSWELPVEGRARPVTLARTHRPLVIITSNQERDMPLAFQRRCLLLKLEYPTAAQLVEIAAHHVPASTAELRDRVRHELITTTDHGISPAEFIDAVRAAAALEQSGTPLDEEAWEDIRVIVLGREPARR
jgi:MoxR-like ATPase